MKLLLLLLLLFDICNSLVIKKPDIIEGIYNHVTASFGPHSGTFIVENTEIILSDPIEACAPLLNDMSGKIALIYRGSPSSSPCYFQDKAYRAEMAGAVAVIVGDNNPGDKNPIQMASRYDSHTVNIPSIAITYETYHMINSTLYNNINNETVYATIDKRGELVTIARIDSGSLALMMIFTMSMFCIGWMCGHCLRRIRERRSQHRRTAASDHLPSFIYRRNDGDNAVLLPPGADSSGGVENVELHTMNTRITSRTTTDGDDENDLESQQSLIHNESCSICLEEFKDDEEVKMLPCRHGYHSDCITPWLRERSDLCPMCKRSILQPSVVPHV